MILVILLAQVDNKTLILVYCLLALGIAAVISARAVLVSIVGLLTAQKFFMNMLHAFFVPQSPFLTPHQLAGFCQG